MQQEASVFLLHRGKLAAVAEVEQHLQQVGVVNCAVAVGILVQAAARVAEVEQHRSEGDSGKFPPNFP